MRNAMPRIFFNDHVNFYNETAKKQVYSSQGPLGYHTEAGLITVWQGPKWESASKPGYVRLRESIVKAPNDNWHVTLCRLDEHWISPFVSGRNPYSRQRQMSALITITALLCRLLPSWHPCLCDPCWFIYAGCPATCQSVFPSRSFMLINKLRHFHPERALLHQTATYIFCPCFAE